MQNRQITEAEIRWEIKKLIASITEREPDEILDTASFAEVLEVDSLMGIEVMVAIDKKFRINIPAEDFVKATNVDEAVSMVMRYLPESSIIAARA